LPAAVREAGAGVAARPSNLATPPPRAAQRFVPFAGGVREA
jgi:hypothetical protein